MLVYELMNALSKLPAGDAVTVGTHIAPFDITDVIQVDTGLSSIECLAAGSVQVQNEDDKDIGTLDEAMKLLEAEHAKREETR